MVFSAIPFLYYFLPLVLLLYYASPRRAKNAVLLLASLVFYSWGGLSFTLLMLLSIAVGYVSGLLIDRFRHTGTAKATLILSTIYFLGMLGYFKYADFFITNFNDVTGLSVPLLRLTLPIGISFYTFQVLSYTIDVYRGLVAVQKDPVKLALFITMFPQLIAGPIVRYSDVESDLSDRTHTFEKAAFGVRRFCIGVGKKVLIANLLGELCASAQATSDPSVLYAWLYAIGFMLQIYFDFSGYSDMAIGLGALFGFTFPENFRHPYASTSVTEFWRRWHMTLGTWFRDYVYIPMGGNRVRPLRWILNIAVVWSLTGFWHGAAWNFLLWGWLFALLLMFEKSRLGQALTHTPVLSRIYVLFAVMISFVLFNAADLPDAGASIAALFGGAPLVSAEALYMLRSYAVILVIAAVGASPLPKTWANSFETSRLGQRVMPVLEPLTWLAVLLVSTAFLVDDSFNPFLYFRF